MSIPYLVLVLAGLMVVIAVAESAARRLALPASIILVAVGSAMGLAATWWIAGGQVPTEAGILEFFADPPIPSAVFIYIFLPTLLFQSSLGIDVAELADDLGSVLMLAVIAVVVSTLAIGFALWPLAGVSLAACLLLGSIVATTDPVAVIGIFRAVGAPERLIKLVEGESLLNDAAAITMFAVFTALIGRPADVSGLSVAIDLLVVPLGGGLVGWLGGRVVAWMIGLVGDNRTVAISLSLALPYAAYVVAEQMFSLSGVIAVVAAGLTLAREGPNRMTPVNWRGLREVWGQLDYWAATLLFLLASMLVPRFLADTGPFDAVLLGALVLAATAARGVIVYGALPLLERIRPKTTVPPEYRMVIFWGGLRGATTLALALAATESAAIPGDIARFVAVLATGYTLFTLLVQGTTLRPLMRWLRLDALTPRDEAIRDDALALAYGRAARSLESTLGRYGIGGSTAEAEVEALLRSGAAAADSARRHTDLSVDERVAMGLVTLARREREIVLLHAGRGLLPRAIVDPLVDRSRLMLDGARLAGELGWRSAAAAALAFDWRDRLANQLQHRTGIVYPLARSLERRFVFLSSVRIVLIDLLAFADERVVPMAGPAAGEAIRSALQNRFEEVQKAIEALHLQYPAYASEIEVRFVRDIRRALEGSEVREMAETGLINPEIERDILRRIEARTDGPAPALDLGLDTAALVARTTLFSDLGAAEQAEIARRLRPVFVYPGHVVMRRGEAGDAAYFISSGAVEVETDRAKFLLGRGDVCGEMSLITGLPRSATVTALGYSALLRLSRRDFDGLMRSRPEIRAHLEALAAERRRANSAAQAEVQAAVPFGDKRR